MDKEFSNTKKHTGRIVPGKQPVDRTHQVEVKVKGLSKPNKRLRTIDNSSWDFADWLPKDIIKTIPQNINDFSTWTEIAETGISSKIIPFLIENMNINQEQLSSAVSINLRTLQRRVKNNAYFNNIESSALIRLLRLKYMALDLFKNEEVATKWLNSPNVSLGGEAPINYISNEYGAREVENVLVRIKYGDFS